MNYFVRLLGFAFLILGGLVGVLGVSTLLLDGRRAGTEDMLLITLLVAIPTLSLALFLLWVSGRINRTPKKDAALKREGRCPFCTADKLVSGVMLSDGSDGCYCPQCEKYLRYDQLAPLEQAALSRVDVTAKTELDESASSPAPNIRGVKGQLVGGLRLVAFVFGCLVLLSSAAQLVSLLGSPPALRYSLAIDVHGMLLSLGIGLLLVTFGMPRLLPSGRRGFMATSCVVAGIVNLVAAFVVSDIASQTGATASPVGIALFSCIALFIFGFGLRVLMRPSPSETAGKSSNPIAKHDIEAQKGNG